MTKRKTPKSSKKPAVSIVRRRPSKKKAPEPDPLVARWAEAVAPEPDFVEIAVPQEAGITMVESEQLPGPEPEPPPPNPRLRHRISKVVAEVLSGTPVGGVVILVEGARRAVAPDRMGDWVPYHNEFEPETHAAKKEARAVIRAAADAENEAALVELRMLARKEAGALEAQQNEAKAARAAEHAEIRKKKIAAGGTSDATPGGHYSEDGQRA